MLLIHVEGKRTGRVLRVQSYTSQGNQISHRRYENITVVVEADETAVDEVIC